MRFITLVLVLWTCVATNAQVTVTPLPNSTAALRALLGQGIELTNFTINGLNSQTALLTDPNRITGAKSMLVLSTGQTDLIRGNATNTLSTDNQVLGNSFIQGLIHQQTYDAVSLTLDFIPQSDTLTLRIRLATDAFPRHIPPLDRSQNDAVTGILQPLTGGVASNIFTQNNRPLTLHQTFFFASDTGTALFNNLAFNAFTNWIVIKQPVIRCTPYRLTITIADGGNPFFDTALLFDADGFESRPVSLIKTTNASPGCDVSLFLKNNTSVPQNITLLPTAFTKTLLPNSTLPVTIPIPSDAKTFVPITITSDICGSTSITDTVRLKELQPLKVALPYDTMTVCSNQPIILQSLVTGGSGRFDYRWSNDPANQPFTIVSVSENQRIFLTVRDSCTGITQTGSIFLQTVTTGGIDPPFAIRLLSNNLTTCFNAPQTLFVGLKGGNLNYLYSFDNQPFINSPFYTAVFNSPRRVPVRVTDGCTTVDTAITVLKVNPPLTVVPLKDTLACYGQVFNIQPKVSGGSGKYFYTWQDIENAPATFTFLATQTTIIRYKISDDCGSEPVIGKFTVFVPPPIILTVPDNLSICYGQRLDLQAVATGGLGKLDVSWKDPDGQNLGSASVSLLAQKSGIYLATARDSCGSLVAERPVFVNVTPVIEPKIILSTSTQCVGKPVRIAYQGAAPITAQFVWRLPPNGTQIRTSPDAFNFTSQSAFTDTVFLDVTLGECKYNTKTVITFNEPAKALFTPPDPLCLRQNYFAFASEGSQGRNYRYFWDFGVFAQPRFSEEEAPQKVRFFIPGRHPVKFSVTNGSCTDTIERFIRVYEDAVEPADSGYFVCDGFSRLLRVAPPTAIDRYLWYRNINDVSPFHIGYSYRTPRLNAPVTYYVEALSPENCRSPRRTPINVKIYPDIRLDIETDSRTVEIPLAIVNFKAKADRPLAYFIWTFGDGDTATTESPVHQYRRPGNYEVTLTAADPYGCIYSVIKPNFITVIEDNILQVPNVFTPNLNDDINDFFYIRHKLLTEFQIQIFNRYGQLVYTANDPDFRWDGRYNGQMVQEGNYIWSIQAKLYNGSTIYRTGTVFVMK